MNEMRNENPVKPATEATLDTVSNKRISLLHPTEDSIDIDDIANALSMICRFGGQLSRFYSVAQHSCLVASLAPQSLKREALLHDASEAYLGDVIKPLKSLLGGHYKDLEFNFESVIFQKFGLDPDKIREVKPFDELAYQIEDKALRQGKAHMLESYMKTYDMVIAGSEYYWRPAVARLEFKKAFSSLFADLLKLEA